MVRVGARTEGAWFNPRIELDVESELPSEADLPWALLPGPAPAAGDLRLAGSATGYLDTGSWPTGAADLVARVAAGDWSGDWRVRGRGLALSHRLADVDVDARGRIASREGAVALIADEDQGATIGTVEESLRASLPVPAAAGRYLSGPLAVSWPGGEVLRLIPSEDQRRGVALSGSPVLAVTWPGQPGRLSLQAGVEARVGGAGPLVRGLSLADLAIEARDLETGGARVERLQLTGDLHELARGPRGHLRLVLDAPRVDLAGLALDGLEAEMSLDLATGDDGTEVVFAEGGAVRAAGWRVGERARAAGDGVVATVAGGRMRLDGGTDWGLDLAVEPFAAQVRAGGRARRLEIDPGRVRVAHDAGGLHLETRDTRVAHAADPAWFAPAVVSARVERNPSGYSISGEGRLGAPAVPFTLTGAAAPTAGAASLRVAVPSVRFRPGGPQPAALAPALGMIRAASGRAGGSLRVQVRPEGVDGTARLTLEDLSFRTQRVRVTGLAGTLALDGLRPPRASGEQSLRAASIQAGVAVTDARLRFGLVRPAGGGTAVAIADASGAVLGGRARIRDWTFEPGAQVHSFTVELDEVELGRVLEHFGVEGLEGRGPLSGRLPVTVADGSVAVRDGRIRGRAGRLALRSPRAVEVLVDSGLVDGPTLQALRDFDYTSLALDIDRTLGGTTTMGIRLEGSNPAVRDGERLDFDVRVTGDIGPLATALAEGRTLTSDLIERSLDLQAAGAAAE
ncbi:MAG: YdbH domain-containing protein [Halofilum sp. (in: g-proteobacteria)]|nr:YdbH domain-containing protein [Halofilum sp. (in: g-proteobacteria)]